MVEETFTIAAQQQEGKQAKTNTSVLEQAVNATKSLRVNRGKNVSPPSREKSFVY